jgi:hypothetical protein
MTFTLTGFKEGNGLRRFVFQGTAADRSRTTVVVGADVSLARKHDIRLQELPLICLRLLESLDTEGLVSPITLTEDHMTAIQTAARSAAEKKPHKPPRRPSPETGQAWRTGRV